MEDIYNAFKKIKKTIEMHFYNETNHYTNM